jgi:dihydroflavonol-4-reductase
MTTLITGATGFIGSAVARELSDKGTRIRCLVRATSNLKNLDGLCVEIAIGDIRDSDAVHRALKGCDRVYHLAAIYANWLPNPGLMYHVNEEGTRNVLAACQAAGIEKIVYCSSVAALGAHGKTPADESAQFNLNSTRDHYYISKYRSEQVALEFARNGLPVVIVNPSGPIGVRDIAPTPTGALIINLLKGRFPGYVDGGINLIDVTDCARGIVAAMERGRVGEKYVLGNRNVSIKEFFDLIVSVAGRGKSPSLRIPSWMAVFSGWGYQMLSRITGKPPVTSASWVRVGSHYSWWDCTKAREELSLGQRPLAESVTDAIVWFEANGYL